VSNPWAYPGRVAPLGAGGGTVTLVDESTFAISDRSGDMEAGSAQGLFVRDTRLISRFEVMVNGSRLESLSVLTPEPFSATFICRAHPPAGRADSSLLAFRSRYVGQGMREDVVLHNYGGEAALCAVEVFIESDFADLFAVKEGRAGDQLGEISHAVEGNVLSVYYRRGALRRGMQLRVAAGDGGDQPVGRLVRLTADLVEMVVVVPPAGSWTGCVEAMPVIDATPIRARYRCGQPVEHAAPSERMARWRQQVPHVETDHAGLRAVIAQSAEDLGSLRIFDPDYPERVVVAAGAPWFMTVFGRDSLLTAWMALLVDPDLALGVLQTLARFQGEVVDPARDEEPGRILHEMRFGEAPSLSLGGGSIYYGTADATPLFVMLLGELRRWGLETEKVDELLPNADRALAWVHEYGDADGDGYVEYHRSTDRGLANQGWKDSWDGIRFADGTIARPPIALCEVQAYCYSAYLARAHFANEAGDRATYERYRSLATSLKRAFNRDFWLDEQGWYAVGLDADKRPIDSLASNMGHCLWTGIVDEDKAAAVARRLIGPEMFSGWGVRTLAESMGGYNPVSYHCGSVWPHDTAIIAAGLARYGFEQEALRLVLSLLDAAAAQGFRLPELFSGLSRSLFAVPVGYPTSCSPQAWAAASPLLCLRTLLRLDPWVPYGKTWLSPMVPPEIGRLAVRGIPLAGARVDVEVDGDSVRVSGLPDHLELVSEPRHPHTAV
jgi:glycogen debranching enzyme